VGTFQHRLSAVLLHHRFLYKTMIAQPIKLKAFSVLFCLLSQA
jgi:hypothetical protein